MKTRFLTHGLAFAFILTRATVLAIGGSDVPPPPSAPHEVSFPAAKETRLANGLRVIVAERPGLPLISADLVIRSGAEVDPNDRAGLADLTASLLTRGTEKMSAPEIAIAIESLGGSIGSDAGWDRSAASVLVMSDKADPAIAILADVVLHPTFKQEEIDRLRTQALDGLRVALTQPGALARFVTARVLFGASPYGHASGGTPETLQAIQRDDIARLYQRYYRPGNAAFLVAGNITLEEAKSYAEKYFGGWSDGPEMSAPASPEQAAGPNEPPRNIVIDLPTAGQAAVLLAKPAIKRASPDYYPAIVANAALGSGFASRLNSEIRIKRGLSYGAGSSLDARREIGPFVASAQTKNESAAQVAGLLQSELKRLGTDPVKGEELKARQAVLTGALARSLETNNGFVDQMSRMFTLDLPLDTIAKAIPSINAVTSEQVTAFVDKFFASPPSLIIVGKAEAFRGALASNFKDVQVIPAAALDLNRAELTKTVPEASPHP